MILVSFCWEKNSIRSNAHNFHFLPRFLESIDRKCCILSGPPLYEGTLTLNSSHFSQSFSSLISCLADEQLFIPSFLHNHDIQMNDLVQYMYAIFY